MSVARCSCDGGVTLTDPSEFPRFKSEAERAIYLAAYDAALRAWPVPFQEIDVDTRFGRTHVVACGSLEAPPLILLPSFAATASVWRANVSALCAHFRVYAMDVIGQPGKSIAKRVLKSRMDYTEWLSDAMDALGVARASFVGASFGGFLALSYAITHPERVERLALISPAGGFAATPIWIVLRMLTGTLRRRIRGLFVKTPPSVADVLGILSAAPEDAPWRELMSVTLAQSPRSIAIVTPVLSDEELRGLVAPMLLLIGEHEKLYDAATTVRRASQKVAKFEGCVVPGGDHLAAMSQPQFVNARLADFLLSKSPVETAVP